jgi:hypothetical protein
MALFWFLDDEILVQLPQLNLQIFERLPIGLVFRVAFQVTTPSVSILHDDVFRGVHYESIAGHFICAREEGKLTALNFELQKNKKTVVLSQYCSFPAERFGIFALTKDHPAVVVNLL